MPVAAAPHVHDRNRCKRLPVHTVATQRTMRFYVAILLLGLLAIAAAEV